MIRRVVYNPLMRNQGATINCRTFHDLLMRRRHRYRDRRYRLPLPLPETRKLVSCDELTSTMAGGTQSTNRYPSRARTLFCVERDGIPSSIRRILVHTKPIPVSDLCRRGKFPSRDCWVRPENPHKYHVRGRYISQGRLNSIIDTAFKDICNRSGIQPPPHTLTIRR